MVIYNRGGRNTKRRKGSSVKHLNVEELWELSMGYPSRSISLSEFAHLWDQEVWGEQRFTFNNVINHFIRIDNAEMSFAIIVTEHNDGCWIVLDGMHRLAKSYVFGHRSIRCVVLPREYNDIVVVGDQYDL